MANSTMVAHVCERGSDAPGLMRYLYGPGRHNEHTDQHMVFGTHAMDAAYSGALSRRDATELGHVVEASWRRQAREQLAAVGAPSQGISSAARRRPADSEFDGVDREHMYHFVLSLPAGQAWSDQQWEQAGWAMVKELGFSDGPDDVNGCKVVGVRHGLSGNGSEHMHIAVNLVREDGRPAQLPQMDYAWVQEATRAVEKQLDFLAPLHDETYQPGTSLPAYSHTEAREAFEDGKGVPDRVLLQQIVRSSALAASNEAEWINAVLDHPGISLEAAQWSAAGEVTGYVVQIGSGRKFAGYELGRDLTPNQLRKGWAETDQARAQAQGLWREELAPADTVHAEHLAPELHQAAQQLATWTNTTTARAATFTDQEYAAAVRTQAALLSTIAQADDPRAAHFTRAAASLSRAATRYPPAPPTAGPSPAQLAARQLQLAIRSGSPHSHEGWHAAIRQMQRASTALASAAAARNELTTVRNLTVAAGSPSVHLRTGHPSFDRGPVEMQCLPGPTGLPGEQPPSLRR